MTCFEQTAAYVPNKAVVRVFLFLSLTTKLQSYNTVWGVRVIWVNDLKKSRAPKVYLVERNSETTQ